MERWVLTSNLLGEEDTMKVTIIGGSRGTGAYVGAAALKAGDEVTVLSRSGNVPGDVRSVVGSATDPAVVREAIAGADAVVVTVGGAKGVKRQRAAATRTVIAAMKDAGVRRLIVQSSLGAGDSASQLPAPLNLITPIMLAKALADHNEQEAAAENSDVDWTIVRPAGLTDKPATGQVKALLVGQDGTLDGSIPRADLAQFILAAVTDESTFGQAIGVSGR
ncbi:NAD(P)-dependent oxidoreductase [Kocuria sp. cx-455]|uniref:NAD(P)-dependent oxidoreductase n=1 Tax=Kocuria sp. cx-455 TaxID=2771377 RepID=UPI003D73CD85